MASLSTNKKTGVHTIYFVGSHGRKKITLGSLPKHQAQTINNHVAALNIARISNTTHKQETATWLVGIGKPLFEKLMRAGLVEPRATIDNPTLAAFLDAYLSSRQDVAVNSLRNLKNSRNKLAKYFGKDTKITTISTDKAHDFHQSLRNSGAALSTISKCIKHAKQFFHIGVRKGMLPNGNPFAGIKCGKEVNESRMFNVDRETFYKITEHCPDSEFALLIACYRILGTRFGEPFEMDWSCIDFTREEVTIMSPKTKRYGRSFRKCPLFPELLPFLIRLRAELQPAADTPLIVRHRVTPILIRKKYLQILKAAGIEKYERLFQNLRSSRITELVLANYSIKSVAKWMGNSEQTILLHYLQATKEEFDRATRQPTGEGPKEHAGLSLYSA